MTASSLTSPTCLTSPTSLIGHSGASARTVARQRELVAGATARARELVEPVLRQVVDGLGPSLAGIGGYHFGWSDLPTAAGSSAAGKVIRPALAMLAAEAIGAPGAVALPAAVAVELVHNFSLIHDDIIDSDEQRRGRPSVWKALGVPAAILIGDVLHSMAFEVLLTDGGPQAAAIAHRLAVVMREVVAGQVQDIEFTDRPWQGDGAMSLPEYRSMAEAKTGALLSFAASAGAQLAGADPDAVAVFDRLGRHLGLAFQCTDDILGIWGDPAITGKPVFGDLREGKKTFPVLAALAAVDPAEDPRLVELLGSPGHTEADLRTAARLIEEAGGREFTEHEAAGQLAEVTTCLDALGMPDEVRESFDAVANSLIGRTR